jgi:hypothetical protein
MELQLIQHSSILFRDVLRVIDIKSVSWPFPVESQLRWILDNVKDDDTHVFLHDGETDLAYLTLSPVKAKLNGILTSFMGVGCVCTRYHGTGLGEALVLRLNEYLLENNYRGLLFCKNSLIPFYRRYDWEMIPLERVHLEQFHDGVFTMAFNTGDVNRLDYSDRLF